MIHFLFMLMLMQNPGGPQEGGRFRLPHPLRPQLIICVEILPLQAVAHQPRQILPMILADLDTT